MTLQVKTVTLQQLPMVYHDPDLRIRLERSTDPEAIYGATLFAAVSAEESLFTRFDVGRYAVQFGSERYEGSGEAVITRLRLLLRIRSGPSSKGFKNKRGVNALVSVERSDLAPPETVMKRRKIARLDFSGTAEPFLIQVLFLSNFADFANWMTPEYAAQRLGGERLSALRAEKQDEAAQERAVAARAEEAQKQQNDRRFANTRSSEKQAGNALRGVGISVFDHRKTWRYKAAATPDQCVNGFVSAFNGAGGMVMKAKWKIDQTPTGAVATYGGRKGLVAVTSILSEKAKAEESGAIGSTVEFKIEETGADYTICAMWLSSNASRLGFVNDGRFFRPYMRAVEACLREMDPALAVVKD